MGEVITLSLPDPPKRARAYLTRQQAEPNRDWDHLPLSTRERALARMPLMRWIDDACAQGATNGAAIEALLGRLDGQSRDTTLCATAARATGRKGMPVRTTLYRWQAGWREDGLMGLVDGHTGKKRQWQGWEMLALSMWLSGARMNAGGIAFNLRGEGWPDVQTVQVRRFIKSLPETLGARAPERVGKHFHQQNIKPHRALDWSNLPVGFMYETDGHTLDWYTRHPLTGTPVRLEFTPVLDKASHYIVGWLVWDRESAINTLVTLSRALLAHDHVPATIHMDPGPGFKNRAITGDLTGFFARLSIRPVFALPGNARGKGLVEGFFGHFEERVGKLRASYCGHCRTDDALRRFASKVAKSEIHVETYEETCALIAQYVQRYNAEPQKGLGGKSPAQLWATLERTPVEWPAATVFRLSEQRVVRKSAVTLAGRSWMADALADHDSRPVLIEYDPQDWGRVWVYDMRRVFITEADLVIAQDGVIGSRIEDDERARRTGRLNRIEQHRLETIGQAGVLDARTIDHTAAIDEMAALEAQAQAALPPKESGAGAPTPAPGEVVPVDLNTDDIHLDLYRTDY